MKMVLFLLIFCVLFYIAQRIVLYEWNYPLDSEDHGGKFREYNSLEDNTVDVIFEGTSHVQYGVNPSQLYKERHIIAYNGSISANRMAPMYYHLKDMLEKQHPYLVMIDVSPLYLNYFNDPPWRKVLDLNLTLDYEKLQAAAKYSDEYLANEEKKTVEAEGSAQKKKLSLGHIINEQSEDQAYSDDEAKANELSKSKNFSTIVSTFIRKFEIELGAILPFYKYHERWTSLAKADFEIDPPYPYYGKGYVYTTMINHAWATKQSVNQAVTDVTAEATYPEYELIGDKHMIKVLETETYRDTPDEAEMGWLIKIKELCDQHNVELQLMKVPVITTLRDYESSWTKARSNKVHEIAKEMGIGFCDMVYDYNVEIDQMTDFRDNGMHLNYYGAKKVTSFLGNYIENVCGIKSRLDRYYNHVLPMYNKIDDVAMLQSYTNGKKYLTALNNEKHGKTIFFAVRGLYGSAFSEKQQKLLNALGLQVEYNGAFGENSYIGVIQNGKSIYEAMSALPVEIEFALDEDHTVTLLSVGADTANSRNPQASIKIDGVEYALNGRGLNIVVYDNTTGIVVDTLNFYRTYTESKLICERNYQKSDTAIRAYEHEIYKYYDSIYRND